MPDSLISIIIPTYNEKDNIIMLIERLSNTFSKINYEIIIVDDDSKDGTAEVANTLTSRYPLTVLSRKNEKGLATAVIYGIEFAKGDIIEVMDADLQHPPEVSLKLLKAIEEGSDLVIASRYIKGGKCNSWGLFRRINSKVALSFSHILLPKTRTIKDPMTGFFMFRRDKIKGIKLKPIGYKILLELLVMGRFTNIAEIPFTFEERYSGKSKLRLSQQIDYLKHIFSLSKRSGELFRIFKYVLVGLSGVIVNLGILWLLTKYIGLPYYISGIISIETSIFTNFIFHNYFTFSDRISKKSNTFIIRLLEYNLNCSVGGLIKYGFLVFFTTIFHLHYLLSDLLGIALAFIWNYLMSNLYIWK
jgi:dolichol-phosphate mannosyltransferase